MTAEQLAGLGPAFTAYLSSFRPCFPQVRIVCASGHVLSRAHQRLAAQERRADGAGGRGGGADASGVSAPSQV